MPEQQFTTGPLAGGIDDSKLEAALGAGSPPPQPFRLRVAENIDFDRGSARSARGSLKLGNQTAPRCGVRTRVDKGYSPLLAIGSFIGGTTSGTGVAPVTVPLRGHYVIPYSADLDVGGDFASEGNFLTTSQTFHNRRGRTFAIEHKFQIPPEEKLYDAPTLGASAATPSVGFAPTHGFDEALDECTIILQKGGDGLEPMSWAIGIVNVGDGTGLTAAPTTRPSNYALVFMWLDAPQFGEGAPSSMKYTLTSGVNPTSGTGASFSTQAYRAILLNYYVVPGRAYSFGLNLNVDTGSPGAAASNTAWNHDGLLDLWVSEDGNDPWYTRVTNTASGTLTHTGTDGATRLEVVRGPTDSLEYLIKYGVRFSGRDPIYLGLGMRFVPWQLCGFIPFGSDCTSLGQGGFRMQDRSAASVALMYGAGNYTLTVAHTSGNAYVTFNHQGAAASNTSGGASPWGVDGGSGVHTRWDGLGAVSGVANCNANALRGYRLVAPFDFTSMRGGILTCLDYLESGGTFRMNIVDGATAAKFGNWAAQPFLFQCFRWHQRDLVHSDLRLWSSVRTYDDASAEYAMRRKLELRQSIDVTDINLLDRASLKGSWLLDDGEGTVCSEGLIGGARSAFARPIGLGTVAGGRRGEKMLFLSGEGEAPTCDLSDNPRWMRELARLFQGRSHGFALEMTFVPIRSQYAIGQRVTVAPESGASTVTGMRARLAPTLLTWESRKVDDAGMKSQPKPILELTHGGTFYDTSTKPFQRPMGFFTGVARFGDQEGEATVYPADLLPFFVDGAAANNTRFGFDAPWVGQSITIQIGVQTTGTDDQYDVYIAMSPKDALNPANGDPSGSEFTYWTDGSQNAGAGYAANNQYKVAHLRLPRYDLARSTITVGSFGTRRNETSEARGYLEMQPCLLVDEVRVYARPAPGALPTANGGVLLLRNGKIENDDVLPPRELTRSDLIRDVGPGRSRVDVTDGSRAFSASDGGSVFSGDPRTSLAALAGGIVLVRGLESPIGANPNDPLQDEVRFVRAASAATVIDPVLGTFEGRFYGPTVSGAIAYHVPLAAYTSFSDDIRDAALTLGPGRGYSPRTALVGNVTMSPILWENLSPVAGGWKLRIYSPLSRIGLRDILPTWVRGLGRQSRNPILGVSSRGKTKYAAAKGSVFEVDDRWRTGGPRPDLLHRFHFRSKTLAVGLTQPLEGDRVSWFSRDTRVLVPSATDTTAMFYDVWCKLDTIETYQTVAWYGSPSSNPAQPAGTHNFHCAIRFNRGRPEFVLGSTAFYTGTSRPEKGLFICTSTTPVAPGEDVHVRFVIASRTNGTIVLKPWCYINGVRVATLTNASQTGLASDEWMQYSTVTGAGTNGYIVVGASFDSYLTPAQVSPRADASEILHPSRVTGWMHSLSGSVCDIAWYRAPFSGSTPPANFNPRLETYQSPGLFTLFHAFYDGPGYGHLVFSTDLSPGVVHSHPFISLHHELGSNIEPASFTNDEAQTFVTTGGRPVRVSDGSAGLAGVLPPTTAPTVRVQRWPLWKPNYRNPEADDAENEPVAQAARGAASLVYHYDSHANNYWSQPLSGSSATESAWTKASGPAFFGFKAMFRARDITGRRTIIRRGASSSQGGPFIELDNGKIRLGWFDKAGKAIVFVETNLPVVKEGELCYVMAKKFWCPQDRLEGNWQNSWWSNGRVRRTTVNLGVSPPWTIGDDFADQVLPDAAGTIYGRVIKAGPSFIGPSGAFQQTIEFIRLDDAGAEMAMPVNMSPRGVTGGATAGASFDSLQYRPSNDVLVFRIFRNEALTTTNRSALDALVTASSTSATVEARNCVSFTCDANSTGTFVPAGCVGTGLVSMPGLVGTGSAAGLFDCDQPVYAGGVLSIKPFHPDMVGKWLSFGTGTPQPHAARSYRIVAVNANLRQVTVIDDTTGTNPDLSGIVSKKFGVFIGVTLVKSQANTALGSLAVGAFDESKSPDDSGTVINWFGDGDAGQPYSGVKPFDGEWWTPGVTFVDVPNTAIIEDARVFEDYNTTVDATGAARLNNDPILTGTDWFPFTLLNSAPTAGVSGAPGELHFNSWATAPRRGTWFSVDGRDYAGAGGGNSTQPNVAGAITRDTANPTCSANAPDATWQNVIQPIASVGTRFFRCLFFDEDQNQPSDPGPEFALRVPGEDPSNPSGAVRYTVSDIPFPRQSGNISVRIGMSPINGSSTLLFQVAEVPAGAKEVGFSSLSDTALSAGAAFLFTNGAPPRCSIVEAGRTRMFYGALESQPDAGLYSRAGFPGAIDFSSNFAFSLFRVQGGDGEAITALRELDGVMLAAKRTCVAAVSVGADGSADVDLLSTGGAGCVGPQAVVAIDGRLYMLDARGWIVVQRGRTASALGSTSFISARMSEFFESGVDRKSDRFSSAAVNRSRGQVVLATREAGADESDLRVSAEYDDDVGGDPTTALTPKTHRFSRYRLPRVRTLASVQDLLGGPNRLLGGTEEGFAVWLDRSESYRVLMGDPRFGYGVSEANTTSGCTTRLLLLENIGPLCDTTLEGQLGVPVLVDIGDGTLYEATILSAGSTSLLLDRALPTAPLANRPVRIGVQASRIETPWMDLGDPRMVKRLDFVTLLSDREVSGSVTVEVYVDYSSQPIASGDVDLSSAGEEAKRELSLDGVEGRYAKVVVRSPDLQALTTFDVGEVRIHWRLVGGDGQTN